MDKPETKETSAQFILDGVFVETRPEMINNNNLETHSPYHLFDGEGNALRSPLEKRTEEEEREAKKTPTCEFCGRTFEKFSQLFAHKGSPSCGTASPVHGKKEKKQDGKEEKSVFVVFPEHQLRFLSSVIKERGLGPVEKAPGSLVDKVSLGKTRSDEKDQDKEDTYVMFKAPGDGLMHLLRSLYFAQISHYNLEQWYEDLQLIANSGDTAATAVDEHYTSPSMFLALSDAELKLIQVFYNRILFGALMGDEMRLTNDEMELHSGHIARIDELIEKAKTRFGTQVFFVRLSTRSPKDGVRVTREEGDTDLDLLTKKNNLLKVRTGEEVFSLLIRSERVFGDITNFFQYRTVGTASGALNLILREWMDELPLDKEFRCYVHNKRMTCISQYNPYHVFASLQDEEVVLRYRDAIVAFHWKIKEAFKMDSYVIDVVVYDDLSIKVIELNPFGANMSSGAGLYNWDADYNLMYNGTGGAPAIRVLRKLISEE